MTQNPNQPRDTETSALPCVIKSHAVLEVRGEDASKFLQGQCSADTETLEINQSVAGAICTVKGRVVSSFFAHKTDQAILLVMPTELVSITHDYLKKYAAFFKTELIPWTHVCVVSNPEALLDASYSYCQVNIGEAKIKLGLFDKEQSEFLANLAKSNLQEMDEELDWLNQLLQSGWIVLNSKTTEEYLPHPLNLDLLGAVNFNKGCYTGQEIIARTEYRGKTKRRVQLISLEGLAQEDKNTELPSDIYLADNDRPVGELINLNAQKSSGLALLPVEMEPQGNLMIQGNKVSYKLDKMPFSFD